MKNSKHFDSGFTLIELLVVIAIIGILSSIILASLNTARNKGVDAAIRSDMDNSRAQSELYYDANNNSYVVTAGTATDICAAVGIVNGVIGVYANLIAAGTALGGVAAVGDNTQAFSYSASDSAHPGAVVCHAAGSTGWAVMSSLRNPTVPNSGWCVDSTGQAKETTTLSANSFICGT